LPPDELVELLPRSEATLAEAAPVGAEAVGAPAELRPGAEAALAEAPHDLAQRLT
jgi:hypothetical protein